MPAEPQFPQPTSRTPREASRPARWFPWKSIFMVSGLMLAVYAVLESPREISRWHMAAANEFWTEAEMASLPGGDAAKVAEYREKAFSKLELALKWSPDDVNWIFKRAQWNAESGKGETALADYNQVIGQMGELSPLLAMRMQVFQQLGRHTEAVKDANQMDALSQTSGYPPRAEMLNTVAYVKAVGKIDLPKALQQADESVRSALAEIAQNKLDDEAELSQVDRFLQSFFVVDNSQRDSLARLSLYMRQDTRGFVHYQLGNYKEALADLDAAAEGITAVLAEREHSLGALRRALPDARPLEIKTFSEKKGAAVILYHRSLAHEKLGNSQAAAADRKRVYDLIGRDANESLF